MVGRTACEPGSSRTPIGYDPFIAGRSVDRVTVQDGRAGGSIATVIVERTVGAGLPAAR